MSNRRGYKFKRATGECKRCGVGFTRTSGVQLYCSEWCQRARPGTPVKHLAERSCGHCCGTYQPKRVRQVYCRPVCRWRAANERRQKEPPRPTDAG